MRESVEKADGERPPTCTSGPAARNGEKMVLPRFTIRTLLALTTLAAVLCVMLGLAFRGQSLAWAGGLLIAVASVGLTLAVHAAWFVVVSRFANFSAEQRPVPASDAAASCPSSADEEASP